jgi:hypothetical protein
MSNADDDSRAASAPSDGEPRPPKKKKKKKLKKRPTRTGATRSTLDEYGRERPRFVLSFPSNPELDELVRAFERGNYAHVRREAPALAARTTDEEVREAALELRRRLDPDPLLGYLLGVAVALLVFLSVYFFVTKAP